MQIIVSSLRLSITKRAVKFSIFGTRFEMPRTEIKWILFGCLLLRLSTSNGTYYRECDKQGIYRFLAIGMDDSSKNGNFLMNFETAEAWCRNVSGRLVTVENQKKHAALLNFMQCHEYNSDDLWIGAVKSLDNKWIWINGTTYNATGSYLQGATDITDKLPINAFLYFPNNDRAAIGYNKSDIQQSYICQFDEKTCQSVRQDYSANSTLHYLRPAVNTVIEGRNGNCYVVFPWDNVRSKKTWFNARSMCNFLNGDLATDIDPLMNNKLLMKDTFWIGLQLNPIVWQNYSADSTFPLTYNAFPRSASYNKDDQTCVVLQLDSRHLTFGFRKCSDPALFVCDIATVLDGEVTPSKNENAFPSPEIHDGQLLSGQIAGITVGLVIFYLISIAITAAISCALMKRRSNRNPSMKPPLPPLENPPDDVQPVGDDPLSNYIPDNSIQLDQTCVDSVSYNTIYIDNSLQNPTYIDNRVPF